MARLPALVDAFSAHDPRGRPTIAHIARQLRNDSEIESTRRGAGGAKMTFRDAATLLIGACGDMNPAGAVKAVDRMRGFTLDVADHLATMQGEDLPEHFTWLRDAENFGAVVEGMIARAPELKAWGEDYDSFWSDVEGGVSGAEFSMRRAAQSLRLPGAGFMPGFARAVRIVFHPPALAAEVHLGWVWRSLEDADAFHGYYAHPDTWAQQRRETDAPENNLITIEVGIPLFMSLHHTVKDG